MKLKRVAIKSFIVLVSGSVILTGCSTAQMQQMKEERNQKLQKTYPSFDACFREEKVSAIAGMALLGAIGGKALGGEGNKGNQAAVLGAVIGGIIGNKIAWGNCLDAFSAKIQTVVLSDRATALTQSGQSPTQATVKSLNIQNLTVSPLVFGRDLDVVVTLAYVGDNPDSRDLKARVTRTILFTSPDGSRQELPSASEVTIQQGARKDTFSIPTPSLQDAPELKSTKDWELKYVFEVDGMRQEKIVPLSFTKSVSVGEIPRQIAKSVAPAPQPAIAKGESISLKRGATLFKASESTAVLVRLSSDTTVVLLQRKQLKNGINWAQVRTPDGKEGWIKESAK